MVKHVIIFSALMLLAGAISAGAVMIGSSSAHDGQKSEKPILLMTPSDLFSNPQLQELALAAQHGNVKEIDSLIAQGVNVNGKGRYGITPLFSAWQVRSKVGFKALLDHGANPNNIWTTGHTLLNLIASSSDPYFLKLALTNGANPNLIAPRSDETPLFPAAQYRDGNINIPILIEAGANLDYQSKPQMNAAWMDAAMIGDFKVVYEMFIAGANYKLKDINNHGIRYWVKFSYGVTMSSEQQRWRNRTIEYLKKRNFWNDKD